METIEEGHDVEEAAAVVMPHVGESTTDLDTMTEDGEVPVTVHVVGQASFEVATEGSAIPGEAVEGNDTDDVVKGEVVSTEKDEREGEVEGEPALEALEGEQDEDIDEEKEEEKESSDAATSTTMAAQGDQAEGGASDESVQSAPNSPQAPRPLSGQSATRQQIVKVAAEDGSEKLYNLTVYLPTIKKPFLGGYRHKTLDIEYHNASSQTPKAIRNDGKERFHRTTQTVVQRTGEKFATQTTVATSTQMSKAGVFVTAMTDKVLHPTKYQTAEERFQIMVEKIIIIQKYFRRWHAKRMVDRLRYAKHQYETYLAEKAKKAEEMAQLEAEAEMERRLNPRTAEDFDLLYTSLESWRKEQAQMIAELPEEQRKTANLKLLQDQTRYLAAIDQLKNIADEGNREARVQRFLDAAANPRAWVNPEYGLTMAMETPENKRAQELRDIYNLVKMTDLSTDERLDALLQLKSVVEPFPSKISTEILGLIQREADLLGRRTKPESLEGLRQRILNLFLQLVETPEFNPEAKRLLQVHQDKEYFKRNTVRCAGSQAFQSTGDFEVSPQVRGGLGKSKAVQRVENRALRREDNTVYRRMLEDLRRREQRQEGKSQCVFLMSVRDIRYLVDTIWGTKSCLSEESDPKQLTLVRWDHTKEWTPWNCLVLAKDEVDGHNMVVDVRREYGSVLLSKVTQRHIRSKQHFTALQSHLIRARKQGKSLSATATMATASA
eukprot:m.130267 g.130267  ORF g.130267 m.130267 type:complete len:722 (-) comp13897_c0_seq2:1186-3351(-)